MELPPLDADFRYGLVAPLGEGGMGRVYRAHDRVLGVDVALKVARPELAANPKLRARFELEVRLAARLHHPHVVPVHDVGQLPDGTPFLVMPIADGGSLAQRRVDWPELASHVGGVLDALATLHARGLLHRDLKPENVLIHQGRALVADLGLADLVDALAMGGSDRSGTPEYMPPEQREGRVRDFGPPLDLFAVGALIARLARGSLVPAGLDEVLDALLHPEPQARFQLAADARHALDALGLAVVPLHRRHVAMLDVETQLGWEGDASGSDTAILDLDGSPEAAAARVGPASAITRRRAAPLPRTPPPEHGRGVTPRASLALFAVREVPLVARDEVRQALWDVARTAMSTGRPAVAVVTGEAGVGKSTVVGSVARALEECGRAEVVEVRHELGEGGDDGVAGSVRRLLRATPGESPGQLEGRIRRWLEADGGDPERAPALAGWARQPGGDPGVPRAFLVDWLRRRAWRGLSVLWIEDAQWAREGEGLALALDLLHEGGAPVAVFVTARPEADEGALRALASAEALVLPLARLDRDATRALLAETITLDEGLASAVARRCEGNPLLVRQLVAHWARAGVLVDHGGLRFSLRPGASEWADLPTDSAALFAVRLESFVRAAPDPEAARARVHGLALAGPALPFVVFEALGGGPELVAAGLFRREGGAMRWDHGLLHETARRSARAGDVRALYRRVADAWAAWGELSGTVVDAPVGLALHGAGAHADAIPRLLDACVAALPAGRLADLDALTRALREAADAACATSDPRGHRAAARVWQSSVALRTGDLRRCEELVDEAIALAPPPDIETNAAAQKGHLLTFTGRSADAVPWLERAEALARAAGRLRPLGLALRNLTTLHLKRGDLAAAERCAREAVATYERAGATADVAASRRMLAQALLRAGRSDEAEVEANRTVAEARAAGASPMEASALQSVAVLAASRKDLDRAESLLRQAIEVSRRAGLRNGIPALMATLGDVARQRGDLPAAEEAWQAYRRWAEERGMHEESAVAWINLGLVAWARRDAEALVAATDAADRIIGAAPHWSTFPRAIFRVGACLLVGEPAEALAAEAERLARRDAFLVELARELLAEATARGLSDTAEVMARIHGATLGDRAHPA